MLMFTTHGMQNRLEFRGWGLCRIKKKLVQRDRKRERDRERKDTTRERQSETDWVMSANQNGAQQLYLSKQASRFWHEGQRRWKHKRDGAGEIGDLTTVKAHYHAVAGLKNNNIINKDKQIGKQEMESKQNWQGHLGFSLEPICISSIIKQL